MLMGCAVLLVVGCAGVGSEAPQKEQGSSPQATASEEARCEGTRTFQKWGGHFTTNDLPGCPNGGLLLGTDKKDRLAGQEGDDKIRGLGGFDDVKGGPGNDILYGGPGFDLLGGDDGDDVVYGGDGEDEMYGGKGEDVLYGGDGTDLIDPTGGDWQQRDKVYCGEGSDLYRADKNDYVDSSCENSLKPDTPKNIHPREA